MEAFLRHERFAWRSLPGCEAPPANPYTTEFFDGMFARLTPARGSWDDVLAAWRAATISSDGGCASNLILLSLFKGRVTAAMCEQGAHERRAQLGALGHLRVFLYLLSGALAGLATNGQAPPDVLAILDLSDRADTALPNGVLKLASTTGACRDSLPVPVSLKGFEHNMLASRWYLRDARPPWPRVPWERKVRKAAWRGTPRPYSGCLKISGTSCSLRAPEGKCACYVARPPPRASQLALAAACTGDNRSRSHAWPHPRTAAVRAASASGAGADDLLDVAFVACSSSRDACDRAGGEGADAGELAKLPERPGWPFVANANFTAVLELDGFGWQAALLSKLTLGSIVITQPTLYPLWYDDLLVSGVQYA